MSANTLVRDVLFRVSDALQDLRPQFKRWTQASLVTYLNDGQRAIAKYVPQSCSRVDAVKLVPGTKQSLALIPAASVIPGDGSDAVDVSGNGLLSVVRNLGTDGETVGNAIRIVDHDILDLYSPGWHKETGTEVSGFVYDPRTPKIFYVTPGVPSATNVWVELSYLADPVDVPDGSAINYTYDGDDTTVISVDNKYTDDLVNFILARAYGKDGENASNQALSVTYGQMFVSSINAQAAALTGVNPNLHSLPANPLSSTPRGNA